MLLVCWFGVLICCCWIGYIGVVFFLMWLGCFWLVIIGLVIGVKLVVIVCFCFDGSVLGGLVCVVGWLYVWVCYFLDWGCCWLCCGLVGWVDCGCCRLVLGLLCWFVVWLDWMLGWWSWFLFWSWGFGVWCFCYGVLFSIGWFGWDFCCDVVNRMVGMFGLFCFVGFGGCGVLSWLNVFYRWMCVVYLVIWCNWWCDGLFGLVYWFGWIDWWLVCSLGVYCLCLVFWVLVGCCVWVCWCVGLGVGWSCGWCWLWLVWGLDWWIWIFLGRWIVWWVGDRLDVNVLENWLVFCCW